MWYQNIGSKFFRFVTKHACDRWTDIIKTLKTAIALLQNVVEIHISDGGLTDSVEVATGELMTETLAAVDQILYHSQLPAYNSSYQTISQYHTDIQS